MTAAAENLFDFYPPRPREWLAEQCRYLAARGWDVDGIVAALAISPAAVRAALDECENAAHARRKVKAST